MAAPLVVPASAWGANDRISYAVIATGARGRYVSGFFRQLGAECAALCDVYEPHLELAKRDAPQARTYPDYRELLDKERSVDAVLIASPDHHHAPMLLAVLQAKKDVYLEKPFSMSIAQSRQMIEAVRATKQVVQVGMQRRSAPAILEAKKLFDEGALGRVTAVKAQWDLAFSQPLDNSPLPGRLDWTRFLGAAPARPLEPMRFRRWRAFRDYAGGNMTDQGAHTMDVVQWFMRSGPPVKASCEGYLAKMEGAEHPDVFSALFRYKNFIATWSLDYCNSYQAGCSITFLGDKGTLILDNSGCRIFAEPWQTGQQPVFERKERLPVDTHVRNFLECVKSRREPNCPVEVAAEAVAGPHMANTAMGEGAH